MTDENKTLVERLRGHAEIMARDKGKWVRFIDAADCVEAADRIEAQAAEIEKLREALTKISLRKWNSMTQGCNAAREANDIARAALGETK